MSKATNPNPQRKSCRTWLLPAIFTSIAFLGEVASNLVAADLDPILKPYRPVVWAIFGLALITTVAAAIYDVRKQRESPPSATPTGPSATIQHARAGRDIVAATGDVQTGGIRIQAPVTGDVHIHGTPSPAPAAPSVPPHPLVDILLITVTDVEARTVLGLAKNKLGHDPTPCYISHKTYYDLGILGGAKTFMVRSEMGSEGPSGSTLTVSEAIDRLAPSAVIMVGIAFGIDPDKQSIGDVLVSRQLLSYELQRVGTGPDQQPVIILRGDRVSASPRLLDRFRDGELSWEGAKVRFGLVLSGQKLVDNVDFRDQLRQLDPDAIGGEMEGVGLYAAAHLHKVDWILVKAICDWADGKKYIEKDKRQQTAAHNAAHFVFHVIERGGLAEAKEPSAVGIKQVQVIIEKDVGDFDLHEQQRFVAVLAALLEVESYRIRVLSLNFAP